MELHQALAFLAYSFEPPTAARLTPPYHSTLMSLYREVIGSGLEIPGLEELETDYTQLFINSIPTVKASPYEASYRPERPEVLSALRRTYGLHGVFSEAEREDHIVAELQFAGYLLEKENWVGASNFLDQHLLAWADSFSKRVAANARTPFYPALAKLAAKILKNIAEALAHEK